MARAAGADMTEADSRWLGGTYHTSTDIDCPSLCFSAGFFLFFFVFLCECGLTQLCCTFMAVFKKKMFKVKCDVGYFGILFAPCSL